MKKTSVLLATLLLSLALCGTIYAKYIKGFVIVNKTEDSVTIQDKDGIETMIKTSSSRYTVVDEVKYDPKRNKLRPDVEPPGC